MRICIATNYDNGRGLEKDVKILRDLLLRLGHDVVLAHTERDTHAPQSDAILFLETVRPLMFTSAPRRFVVPNPEFWPATWDEFLPGFEQVLCKTRDAERIFSARGAKTVFSGWSSEDRLDTSVPRENKFLHVAGASRLKGTNSVLGAWALGLSWPLTVVSSIISPWMDLPPGVTVLKDVSDSELRQLQNSHRFHVQPSEYEGFGHVLWESRSCGALLVGTEDTPGPCAVRVPVVRRETMGAAQKVYVSSLGVFSVVRKVVDDGTDVRVAYMEMTKRFEETIVRLF